MQRLFLTVVVVVWCTVHGTSGSACPATSPPTHKPVDREAQGHLSAGNRAYKAAIDKDHPLGNAERERQLERAISEYTAGQRCEDAFVFDFNLGQAYAALGSGREALEHLQRFLDRAELDAEDRTKVKRRITAVDPTGKLRAERAAQHAPGLQAANTSVTPQTETTRTPNSPITTVASMQEPPAQPMERAPISSPGLTSEARAGAASRSSVRWGRIVGWSATTTGLVGGGVTTWLVLDAHSLDEQASDAGVNQQVSIRRELTDRAAARRRTAVIVGVGSGVVLVTGLMLALWPSADRAPTRASWNLDITANGMAVAGQF